MLEKEELLKVVGGVNITGAFINSIYRGINSVLELGRSFGSALRRIKGGKMCPIS